MKTRLRNLWESIRSSFWFIPSLMLLPAFIISFVLTYFDKHLNLSSHSVWGIFYSIDMEGARSVLSTIAGSMITVAGVTFSITIVALNLASSQFGPRLLRNFMQDRGTQFVLGTFISTFIYCILALSSVHTSGAHAYIPGLTVSFGVALALCDVCVLIFFIHHISTSIQADNVIAALSHDLEKHIHRIFTEEIERDAEKETEQRIDIKKETNRYAHVHHLTAVQSGYLQAIDCDNLLVIAKENDFLLHFQHRAGDFIINGSPIVSIRSGEMFDGDIGGDIVGSFIIGAQRTPEQDAEYAIHQIVEVAVRSLSPGTNDPYTAITCIDQLGSALCYLSSRQFPSPFSFDDEKVLRIIAKPTDFKGMLNAAFDQIRQYGHKSVAVTIRLLETLLRITNQTRHSDQRQAIYRQAKMIQRVSFESLPEKNDKEDVLKRYEDVLKALNESEGPDGEIAFQQ